MVNGNELRSRRVTVDETSEVRSVHSRGVSVVTRTEATKATRRDGRGSVVWWGNSIEAMTSTNAGNETAKRNAGLRLQRLEGKDRGYG